MATFRSSSSRSRPSDPWCHLVLAITLIVSAIVVYKYQQPGLLTRFVVTAATDIVQTSRLTVHSLLKNTTASIPESIATSNVTTLSRDGAPPSTLCPKGVPDAIASLDMVNLTAQCMEPDLQTWSDRVWGIADLNNTYDIVVGDLPDIVALMQVKDQQLTFLDRPNGPNDLEAVNPVMEDIVTALRSALQDQKIQLPDTTFILNVRDESWCDTSIDMKGVNGQRTARCSAPVFSPNRRVRGFDDIVVPNFQQKFEILNVPWELKKPLAFFRGTPFCNGDEHYIGTRRINCSRLILSEMSREYPHLLNSTITEDFDFDGRLWKAEWPNKWVPREEHANYYLNLNLDGYTASYRLDMLLQMNSAVLKQHSIFEEHYYRALQPCVHYVPFWEKGKEEDILDVIKLVQQDTATAQAIASNGQTFALNYLTDDGKLQYWESLLHRYAAMLDRNEEIIRNGRNDDQKHTKHRRSPSIHSKGDNNNNS